MSKKSIIARLQGMGYKANYRNVLVSTFEKGYVLILSKNDFIKVSVANW